MTYRDIDSETSATVIKVFLFNDPYPLTHTPSPYGLVSCIC